MRCPYGLAEAATFRSSSMNAHSHPQHRETRGLSADAAGLAEAVDLLMQGRLVAFPTDTVYGLAARADSLRAVDAIFAAKGRPLGRPLILMAASVGGFHPSAQLDRLALGYAQRYWPGPLTLVVKARDTIGPPLATRAPGPTVGLRIPDHPVALALLRQVEQVLATTSANRSGEIDCCTAEQVDLQLHGRVAAILDTGGRACAGSASTVLDLSDGTPRILRAGELDPDVLLDYGR